MTARISGVAPVFRSDARILILGSMPSAESLRQSFYYAHPRNCFWPMLAQILAEKPPEDDAQKAQLLLRHRIALWDSVRSCEREGSLDSAIRTPVPNDFEYLYAECPGIETVLFNGAAAQQLYMRLVKVDRPNMRFVRLPSTSPAYTLKYEQKLRAWARAIKEAVTYAESR